MHELYNFHFLDTVSRQLHEQLMRMSDTPLTATTLYQLSTFQDKNSAVQGVYVLHHCGNPVYVGKASNMKSRLTKHMNKIAGRTRISLSDISYKALLLDKSMSTAANEAVLMELFKQSYSNMWNNSGFGPNDPGKERDTTEPGEFDRNHPIQRAWPISLTSPPTTVGKLAKEMKKQLPFVFRYQNLNSVDSSIPIDVSRLTPHADVLFQALVTGLGTGWKGAILSYGMVLYKNAKSYPYGTEILP